MGKEGDFYEQIRQFNGIYKLPINEEPTLPDIERLKNFKSILQEELREVDEIIAKYENFGEELSREDEIALLTDLSDWLGDMVVYITSESLRCGIDLKRMLNIIMQSNFSKLGSNGEPIYDERGKVMKGPNYWRPEPTIREMIEEQLK